MNKAELVDEVVIQTGLVFDTTYLSIRIVVTFQIIPWGR